MEEGEDLDDLKFGNKMVLLMDILKESALIGDKVVTTSVNYLNAISLVGFGVQSIVAIS